MTDGVDPTTITESTFSSKVVDAMIEVLKSSVSPEMLEAQVMLMRRLALSGDVVPSRLPAPRDITEVGGYLNLLQQENQPELRAQVLASIFGVAGPNPPLGWQLTKPVLAFLGRVNDRTGPTDEQAAAIPLEFTVRSDFALALDAALTEIHEKGCELPVMSSYRVLPSASIGGEQPDLLRLIGRTLELVPTAALRDPDADPLALARDGGGLQLVALQLDPTAPRAGEVAAAQWIAWKCDSTSCQEDGPSNRTYLALTPVLNQAGWFQNPPGAPVSLSQPGTWNRWTNTSGLIAGTTRYGDELRVLYVEADIAASSVADQLGWIWEGSEFKPAT
jgi:hypothetical protein